jgi:hypothetical protein
MRHILDLEDAREHNRHGQPRLNVRDNETGLRASWEHDDEESSRLSSAGQPLSPFT